MQEIRAIMQYNEMVQYGADINFSDLFGESVVCL